MGLGSILWITLFPNIGPKPEPTGIMNLQKYEELLRLLYDGEP
jgi:hypothetical protein